VTLDGEVLPKTRSLTATRLVRGTSVADIDAER